jgi:acyl transferase domain-containing protein/aryl carrier-like protein
MSKMMNNNGRRAQDAQLHGDLTESRDPIAIVGIGCRFPGEATTPAMFWQNLQNGVDAIRVVPADRWNPQHFYHEGQVRPGRTQTQWGGFVDNIDQFDPQFFGISPREAARMDPQQRMLLEVAWEALEDGGQSLGQIAGSKTAVFVGISSWDYAYQGLSCQDRGVIGAYSNTGGSLSIASNRISYCLDLRGPAASVDTACSSALVSLHLACNSIWNEGCPLALAGGVNALLMPDFFIAFSQLNMLSPDGRCKTFDARANGFVRGEGAGMVLLKPLALALADNDRVYAVIRGTAVNQDGRTAGMTVPRQAAQEALLRQACQRAGVQPRAIQYVEAHGTGTPVGDPIETRALGSVLSADRPADQPCVIGSVKTNIGHLEAGAGIASLIKVALSLYHGRIPRNLHFEQPNPDINFDELKLRVPLSCEEWPQHDGTRLAGINGFGYGGTNAHVIMQDAPRAAADSQAPVTVYRARTCLVPISARSTKALNDTATRLHETITGSLANASLREIAGTVAHRRSHHDHRIAIVADSKDDLTKQLAAIANEQPLSRTVVNRASSVPPAPLTFVCSGQGPQWWGMGRELLEREPVYRNIVERCDVLSRELGPWSLSDELLADESHSRMSTTAIAQPAIFAVQAALGELWRSWGIEPSILVGHSVGEVAAAYLADVFSLEEAFRIVYHRGRCMDLASSRGRMLAVGLSLEEAQDILDDFGDEVTIAAVNSPTSMTLSGTAEPLDKIAALLEDRQVFWRRLKVEYAFHSSQMDPVRAHLLESLKGIRPAKAQVPLYSTVTGDRIDGPEMDAEYWWLNVRETVRFADAIEKIAKTDSTTALELSPNPVLAYSVTECYQLAGKSVRVLPSLKREESDQATMLCSLGELHTVGYPIAWEKIAPKPDHFLQLPTYAWQRERCWFESAEAGYSRRAPLRHPLLGVRQDGPTPAWQNRVGLQQFPHLSDHRVQGMTVFPAAGYLEMAMAVAADVSDRSAVRISNLQFVNPCVLTAEEDHWFETQLLATDRTISIHSRLADAQGDWTTHAVAEIQSLDDETSPAVLSAQDIQQRCTEPFDNESCYRFFDRMGLDYGPQFRGIVQGWRREGESLAVVEAPAGITDELNDYRLHPALLDACFHAVIPADEEFDERVTGLYLPVQIQQVNSYAQLGSRLWCHALLKLKTATRMVADLNIYNENGQLALQVLGLCSHRVTGNSAQESLDDLLYSYEWRHQPLTESERDSDNEPEGMPQANGQLPHATHWLVFADRTGVADRITAHLRARGDKLTLVYQGDSFVQDGPNRFQVRAGERDDMLRLLRAHAASEHEEFSIIHFWNLDAPSNESLNVAALESTQIPSVLSVLHLVQAWDAIFPENNARLLLVTRGAQSVASEHQPASVAQSPIIGFGRVVVSEYPKFRCKLIDIDPADRSIDGNNLIAEMSAEDDEDEVALRGGERYVHRYVPITEQERAVCNSNADMPYRLEIGRSGTIESLELRTAKRCAPAPGEVEIEIVAAALNFSDVMKVLGLYPGLPEGPVSLGAECAGVVARVGQGVTEYAVGDEVVAVAPFAFGSHGLVSTELVAKKPSHLSFEEAATIPIAFLTAAHALDELAQMEQGESVLIHSASGGVGLAAVQLAQRAGVNIFATAGTESKREYLAGLGVEHVMDSRSLAFADQLVKQNNGRGVDIILNSLPGEAIPRGLDTLAECGRFLEIGKRDIYGNSRLGLHAFRNNLSFFAIDLDQLMRKRPQRIGRLLRKLMAEFDDQRLAPLPSSTFPISDIQAAFSYMRQGKHIGKIVISMKETPTDLVWGDYNQITFRPDATYLIAGGLGGFGLALAKWMVEHGARHLALMGRRGIHSPKAQRAVDALREAGAEIVILKADISNEADVAKTLRQIRQTLPRLRGVFHSAMVLEDGLLLDLDRDWMQRVMAPKINGSWALHEQTADDNLDHFVLFSSLSSVFGHAGQGNYAAANAFLDTLAHTRRAMDLPCLTINWGYLGDVGYLAEREQLGERLERQGVMSFSIQQALNALERAIQQQAIQISVMRVDWSRWRGLGVTGKVSPRFAHLLPRTGVADGGAGAGLPPIEAIRSAPETERFDLVDRLLREKASRLLGVAPERLDSETPLLDLGLDSLMAVELRNWFESELEINLPVVQLMRSPNLGDLTRLLCEHLVQEEASRPEANEVSASDQTLLERSPEQLLENIDDLSSEQVDELLMTMLEDEGGAKRV